MKKLVDIVRDAMAAHPKKLPLNDRGELIPDPTPMAPPIGYRPQPDMMQMIRDQVRLASIEAARDGLETEDEADDFDVGDDPEIRSPYELDVESEVPIKVLKARAEAAQLDYMEAKREAGLRMQSDASGNPMLPDGNTDGSGGGARGGSQEPAPPSDTR